MNRRRSGVKYLLLFSMMCVASAAASHPISPPPGSIAYAPSAFFLIGHGCGWDYPCPPDPYFARRFRNRQAPVSIHNNYGEVNVYVDGRARAYAYGPDRIYLDGRARREISRQDFPEPYAGVSIDDDGHCIGNLCEQCGPYCWFHRFKEGYCGHGCEVYREKVGFEPSTKIVEYPRPFIYRDAPYLTYQPPHAGFYPPLKGGYPNPPDAGFYPAPRDGGYPPDAGYYAPKGGEQEAGGAYRPLYRGERGAPPRPDGEAVPRRRFEGPEYPPR
ncbi:MAG TPA: hypothetical protein VE986_09780 [Hyphomicrobiales bacterium]|nr:hypothetical protein [Hyphomicrobiales bacterium]